MVFCLFSSYHRGRHPDYVRPSRHPRALLLPPQGGVQDAGGEGRTPVRQSRLCSCRSKHPTTGSSEEKGVVFIVQNCGSRWQSSTIALIDNLLDFNHGRGLTTHLFRHLFFKGRSSNMVVYNILI